MFESKLNRGKAGGYAPLDSSGKVPLDKLPINTGSYAITGSNSFFGNQTISGSIILSGSLAQQVNYAPSGSGSFSNPFTDITILDVTKNIHLIDITDKNDDSHFYLPNGLYDGQVVRFALKGNNINGPNSVYIWMNNLRTYNGNTQSEANWSPFYCGEGQGPCRSLATALYIDGEWNIDTDWWNMD